MATATTCSALGAILVLAAATPALAGGYWDGPDGGPPPAPPSDYAPSYGPGDCPPPPCQPCWRGGGHEQQGWSDEAPPEAYGPPPEEALAPPEADYLEGGVGPEVVEAGGGGFGGDFFQPGLAIAAQFDFGERGFDRFHVREHVSAYAHASAHAQVYQHMSYGMRSYGHMGYAPMGSYGHAMAYRPSYHPMMMGRAYRRR